VVIILAGLLAYVGISYYPYLKKGRVGCGYKAKILCCGVFISKRNPESVIEQDLSFHHLFDPIKTEVNLDKKEVEASIFGLVKAKAIHIDKLGSILLSGTDEENVRSWPVSIPEPEPANPDKVPWPTGDLIFESEHLDEIDLSLLDKALDKAFGEPDPERPRRTRAVAVAYKGDLIAERYAPGFTKDTPLIGWSLTKSIISALVGIRVKQGKLDIYDPAPVPEWQDPDDLRRQITLDHLLRMSSGLEFDESYASDPLSDVNIMLFTKRDMGAFAASFPLVSEPGTDWAYASGTTAIIARIIRHSFDDYQEYLSFPRRELFNKTGMRSTIMQPDASGTFAGPAYATARDWVRFGLLYLNNGVWEGEKILPSGWVEYTVTPAPASTREHYGAQFWLNKTPGDPLYPGLPPDAFFCRGYQGQSVTIIPSMQLVAVRLGMTTRGGWDTGKFVSDIIGSIK